MGRPIKSQYFGVANEVSHGAIRITGKIGGTTAIGHIVSQKGSTKYVASLYDQGSYENGLLALVDKDAEDLSNGEGIVQVAVGEDVFNVVKLTQNRAYYISGGQLASVSWKNGDGAIVVTSGEDYPAPVYSVGFGYETDLTDIETSNFVLAVTTPGGLAPEEQVEWTVGLTFSGPDDDPDIVVNGTFAGSSLQTIVANVPNAYTAEGISGTVSTIYRSQEVTHTFD